MMIVTLWRIVGLPEVKGERNFTIPHLAPWKLQTLLRVQWRHCTAPGAHLTCSRSGGVLCGGVPMGQLCGCITYYSKNQTIKKKAQPGELVIIIFKKTIFL